MEHTKPRGALEETLYRYLSDLKDERKCQLSDKSTQTEANIRWALARYNPQTQNKEDERWHTLLRPTKHREKSKLETVKSFASYLKGPQDFSCIPSSAPPRCLLEHSSNREGGNNYLLRFLPARLPVPRTPLRASSVSFRSP